MIPLLLLLCVVIICIALPPKRDDDCSILYYELREWDVNEGKEHKEETPSEDDVLVGTLEDNPPNVPAESTEKKSAKHLAEGIYKHDL